MASRILLRISSVNCFFFFSFQFLLLHLLTYVSLFPFTEILTGVFSLSMLSAPLSLLFLPLHLSFFFPYSSNIHPSSSTCPSPFSVSFLLPGLLQHLPFPFLCVSHASPLWSSSISQCFLTFSPSLLCHTTFSKHKPPPLLYLPLPLYLFSFPSLSFLSPQLSTFPPLQFAFLLTPPSSSSCPERAPWVLDASVPLSPSTCHHSSLTRAPSLLCPLPVPS